MNNYYLKLNQVMLKLFNNNLLLETFNPVFFFNLHIYKSPLLFINFGFF